MLDERSQQAFLKNVSLALGRTEVPAHVEKIDISHGVQHEIMRGFSQAEIIEAFKKECGILGIRIAETDVAGLPDALIEAIEHFDGGKVIYPDDERIDLYGLRATFDKAAKEKEGWQFIQWDTAKGREENINAAQDASIGVTFPIMALAETATLVQQATNGSGRSIGLLPITHIAIVDKSTIVPRMTQSSAKLREMYAADPATFPSNIVHISGPSNSADIELVKVIGVHGPVNVTYILLDQ